jgi:SAM-dependent methyltransferase
VELLSRRYRHPSAKTNFADVYDQPDPAAYYQRFATLDYRIPAYNVDLLRAVLSEAGSEHHRIVDVCCSYGINAALLNHDLTLAQLYAHYQRDRPSTGEDGACHDRAFFATRRLPDAVEVVGVDVSEPAIRYAIDAGLLSGAVTTDLEHAAPTAAEAARLADATVICISGGLGYVTATTFLSIVGSAERLPIVTGFALRWVDLRPLVQVLSTWGFWTAVATGRPYPQRRFASDADRAAALSGLSRLRLPPTVVELRGYHAAIPFIAVPRAHPGRRAILRLLSRLPGPTL